MTSYRAWLKSLAIAPLGGEYGDKLLSIYGLVADMVADAATTAVEARNLYSASFPADALKLVGSERGMPRYPSETDFSYAMRLKGAWRAYLNGGTFAAVVAQLLAAGLRSTVVENHEWNWDSRSSGPNPDWVRFWTVFDEHPFRRWQLGTSHKIGGGQVIGLDATRAQLSTARSIIRKWKAGHARLEHMIFVTNRPAWEAAPEPAGTWDDPMQRPHGAAVFVPARQELR